jgi:hypothetical protein
MATARTAGHRSTVGVIVAALLALSVPALLAATADSLRGHAAGGDMRPAGRRPATGFSWLRIAAAPVGWARATIASGGAMLFYPAAWARIPGDSGTVTASLRDAAGTYHGYLNVTPREGAEQTSGWAGFRTRRNRAEGDRQVHELDAAEGLRFRGGEGSCVIDDYLSRVGSHPYREIACIVAGRRATNVFVGAALQRDWPALGPVVERAASTFLER